MLDGPQKTCYWERESIGPTPQWWRVTRYVLTVKELLPPKVDRIAIFEVIFVRSLGPWPHPGLPGINSHQICQLFSSKRTMRVSCLITPVCSPSISISFILAFQFYQHVMAGVISLNSWIWATTRCTHSLVIARFLAGSVSAPPQTQTGSDCKCCLQPEDMASTRSPCWRQVYYSLKVHLILHNLFHSQCKYLMVTRS